MSSEFRALRFKLEGVSDADGTFEGYASTFGNIDLDGDIVERGAFAKTIDESNGVVPILWQHDPYDPIGFSRELIEDDHGLKVVGELNMDAPNGARARSLMHQAAKMGAKFGLSIGYRVIKDAVSNSARHLQELELREFSPVTFPANPAAGVLAVKHAEAYMKEGRVLSAASKRNIRDAIESLQALLDSTEIDEAATSDDEPAKATLGAFKDLITSMKGASHER